MEKRQLDFNAPLLSARRYSSPSRSTEFVIRKATEKPLPERQQSLPVNKPEWMMNEEEVTKPAAVPFHWEQIPGRPKGEVESQVPSPEEPLSNTPRLPPARVSDAIRRNSGESPRLGRFSGPLRYNSGERPNDHSIYRSQFDLFSHSDHAMLLEKLNESFNCKDGSDSESADDAYSDALDELSPTESQSLKCSMSGLSGYQSSGVKPSGTFCVDKQTRDFMMNRFLPAAKAAVIETPQYVTKKSPALSEPPKYVRRAVSGEIKPSIKEYSSVVLPCHNQYRDEAESEDEDRECSIPVKKPGKVWGILPRFCVKKSLCLLNPLPGMKSRTRLAAPPTPPPANEIRRLTRKALSGPLDKNSYHEPSKAKFHSGLLSRDVQGIEDKLNSDYKQFLNSRDSFKLQLSPLRRYRSGNVSPYRNESPKSPFREGVGFLGLPKEADKQIANKIASSRKLFKALQDVSRNQNSEKGPPGTRSDAVEKPLYVEFVNKSISKPAGEGMKVLSDRQQIENINAGKSDQDSSNGKKKPSPKAARTSYKSPSATCTPKAGYIADAGAGLDAKLGSTERKSESYNAKETDHPLKSPLPPPLPKSPSESWLRRTLPSISLGNPFAHSRQRSHLHPKKDTKWETIVKTTNLQHDHARYSEELTPHAVCRQSKP